MKLGESFKVGQLLQIGACSLQIGAAITIRSNYYELVHNNENWKLNFYLKSLGKLWAGNFRSFILQPVAL